MYLIAFWNIIYYVAGEMALDTTLLLLLICFVMQYEVMYAWLATPYQEKSF